MEKIIESLFDLSLLDGEQPHQAATVMRSLPNGSLVFLCFDKHGKAIGYNYTFTRVSYQNNKVMDGSIITLNVELP